MNSVPGTKFFMILRYNSTNKTQLFQTSAFAGRMNGPQGSMRDTHVHIHSIIRNSFGIEKHNILLAPGNLLRHITAKFTQAATTHFTSTSGAEAPAVTPMDFLRSKPAGQFVRLVDQQ